MSQQSTSRQFPMEGSVVPNGEMETPERNHILIVEDEPVSQCIMQYVIQQAGYTCEIVEKGEDAVECIKNKNYALIFMDIGLPGKIDGTEATREIREYEQKEALRPLPIIAISAHILKQDHPRLFSAGCNEVLIKPTPLEKIVELLQQYAPISN